CRPRRAGDPRGDRAEARCAARALQPGARRRAAERLSACDCRVQQGSGIAPDELQGGVQSRAALSAPGRPQGADRRLPPRHRDAPRLRRRALLPREGVPRRGTASGRGRAARAQRPRARARLRVRAAWPLRAGRRVLASGPPRRRRARGGARPRARAGPPSLRFGGAGPIPLPSGRASPRPQITGAAGAPIAMPTATETSPLEPAPPPSVLIVGSEAVPFAKTGGLADVLGAL